MSDTQLNTDVRLASTDEIIPYGENPKEHPEEQVDKIASSIRRFGWDQPIVVDGEGTIIKGHGRYQAAKRLGLDEVPVIEQADLSEAEARAARIADNRVAESDWDDDLLGVEMQLIEDSEIPLAETGFDSAELDELLDEAGPEEEEGEDLYTDRIETPVYEPTGDKPPLGDLYEDERFRELLTRIEDADIDEETRAFLRLAAHRHIVFDYEDIAEFYAHEDPAVQELMEALTLVIVDYEQAVEQGFINFAERFLEGEADE